MRRILLVLWWLGAAALYHVGLFAYFIGLFFLFLEIALGRVGPLPSMMENPSAAVGRVFWLTGVGLVPIGLVLGLLTGRVCRGLGRARYLVPVTAHVAFVVFCLDVIRVYAAEASADGLEGELMWGGRLAWFFIFGANGLALVSAVLGIKVVSRRDLEGKLCQE